MKYELTNETCMCCNHTLHRIIATQSFGLIAEGQLGGFIESEANLSQDGECWVGDNAHVFGNAIVCDNAVVEGNGHVFDNAIVRDNANVDKSAWVYGNAVLSGNAIATDNTSVFGDAQISGSAIVVNNTKIDSLVQDNGIIDIQETQAFTPNV